MDFPSTAAAPRICYVGDKFYMVRPLSLEGHAIVLQWLDDVIPGQAERKLPPRMDSPEAQDALQKPMGKALMIWLALRGHGISENEAAEVSDRLTEVERYLFIRALQTRRRDAAPRVATTEAEEDRDLSETWCAHDMAKLVLTIGYKETMGLTLDQYGWLTKWLFNEGSGDDDNPAYSPEKLAEVQAKMEAKWGDKLAALNAASEGQD